MRSWLDGVVVGISSLSSLCGFGLSVPQSQFQTAFHSKFIHSAASLKVEDKLEIPLSIGRKTHRIWSFMVITQKLVQEEKQVS